VWHTGPNQLGTPESEEFSERDPNFLNYVQQIFKGGEACLVLPRSYGPGGTSEKKYTATAYFMHMPFFICFYCGFRMI